VWRTPHVIVIVLATLAALYLLVRFVEFLATRR
jgi:hypothetical protein